MDKIVVGMVSLGCPKNQVDAEMMLAKLKRAGCELTADAATADVVVINTCGFINDAKQEAIDTILEFAELKKAGVIRGIVVTGCLAQRYQDEVADEFPECDVVLGLGSNHHIADAVERAYNGDKVRSFPTLHYWRIVGERVLSTPPHYAYLRIADGCNNNCSYCAIPSIRGRLRSRNAFEIVEEAKRLAEQGVKELIIVAQDPAAYGLDIYDRKMLPLLLEELCRVVPVEWIRLMYCHPEHVDIELVRVMERQPKIVHYLDMPIQHVSPPILRAMNRRGSRKHMAALVKAIRRHIKQVALRTTVIVGAKFERLGCFMYSPEEGTPAASLPDQVPEEVKQHRYNVVMELQSRITHAWLDDKIGKRITILVDGFDEEDGVWYGRTYADAPDVDYRVVLSSEDPVQAGDFVKVRIVGREGEDLIGERV